jgi:DNA-binding transcriptional LysR family regulator
MAFDFKSLELFVRVAALGAIGRAGTEFGLSPTNATQRIQALEAELGVKLLNRTTRAVSLTPDGEIFLDYARRILNDAEDARSALSQDGGAVSGLIRATASASFGRTHIVPFVPEFLAQYPQVRLDLNFTDSIVDIVEQGYDLAFRIGELAPSSLMAQKIDSNPMRLVASPEYLARAGVPRVPEDLLGHSCLPLGDSRTWRLRGADGSVTPIRVSGPVKVNLGNALGEWTVAGLGIGVASLWAAGPDLKAGRLVTVLEDYRLCPETDIWAVRPPGRHMPVRVKVFLDFMRERIIAANQDRYGGLCR